MKTKNVNVRMTEEELAKLRKHAEEVGESMSVVVRQAVREQLPTHIAAITTPPKRRA